MTDFEAALRAKLDRNAEIAATREAAEAEMDRAKAEREEAERRRADELMARRNARHAELAEHLAAVAAQLKAAAPDDFVVRTGWTESGEEFIAKISSRQMTPARSLLVELDRDDDEVLARWISDVGSKLELWRLLEVEPAVITAMVLQVADQDLWRNADQPPSFPKA
jgi:electron transfer flavoprotein alpha subunit